MSRRRSLSLLLAAGATLWLLALVLLQGHELVTAPWAAALWFAVGAGLGSTAAFCAWARGSRSTPA